MQNIEQATALAVVPSGRIEYRLEHRAGPVILLFHGGHTRAALPLAEESFAAAGHTILAVSRPGYGRTPLSTGAAPTAYTGAVRALCGQLGIVRVAAVVGISGGGPTAVAMAANHPDLVERVVLISAVGPLPWPDRLTRCGAQVFFAPGVEAVTWAGIRILTALPGQWPLRLLLRPLSLLPARRVVAELTASQRQWLRALFGAMRSGRGFLNDLRPGPDLCSAVAQPTLVIATRHDGGVPFAHAESLLAGIPHAELVVSQAASHFVWCAPDWPALTDRLHQFLASPE